MAYVDAKRAFFFRFSLRLSLGVLLPFFSFVSFAGFPSFASRPTTASFTEWYSVRYVTSDLLDGHSPMFTGKDGKMMRGNCFASCHCA
jgi:hypothetical protein